MSTSIPDFMFIILYVLLGIAFLGFLTLIALFVVDIFNKAYTNYFSLQQD